MGKKKANSIAVAEKKSSETERSAPFPEAAPAQPSNVETSPLIDRTDRGGNIGRLLLVGLGLLGIVGLFSVLPDERAQQITLVLLALLSMIGVFFLFAMAIGFVHLTSRTRGEGFARAFVDGLGHGAVVTDWEGRIVYANRAYGELTGAENARDVATIERVFSKSDEASEIVYRLNQPHPREIDTLRRAIDL
ncbi:MAG: hypothetical protein AAGF28_08205 [Pseudomonadota bacterium]